MTPSERDEAVFLILSEAADRTAQCPTNEFMGEVLGCSYRTTGEAVVRLRDAGRIEIIPQRGNSQRVITIVGTGKTTKPRVLTIGVRVEDETGEPFGPAELLAAMKAGGERFEDELRAVKRPVSRITTGRVSPPQFSECGISGIYAL